MPLSKKSRHLLRFPYSYIEHGAVFPYRRPSKFGGGLWSMHGGIGESREGIVEKLFVALGSKIDKNSD